ncbi:unnamed protein product, partial [Mesorhabditis belari]|uniref:F-box domain-containing protein n=1 Tax=Mesorhabditis belari TaxID=2138241 RepID=A0AAF3J922_9BILA
MERHVPFAQPPSAFINLLSLIFSKMNRRVRMDRYGERSRYRQDAQAAVDQNAEPPIDRPVKENVTERLLKKFPINSLPQEMKVAILNEVTTYDTVTLLGVNKEFRRYFFGTPWRIFGKRASALQLSLTSSLIQTTPSSLLVPIHSQKFAKQVHLCNSLQVICKECRRLDQGIGTDACCRRCHIRSPFLSRLQNMARFLEQLKTVNKLEIVLHYSVFKDLFSNFKASITSQISLTLHDMEMPNWIDPEPLIAFAETYLQDCKVIELKCWNEEQFALYRSALTKSNPEAVFINVRHNHTLHQVIDSFVHRGFPGKNREAAFFFKNLDRRVSLDQYNPVIEQIVDENQLLETREIAAESYQRYAQEYSIQSSFCYRETINQKWDLLWVRPMINSDIALVKFISKTKQ